MREKMVKNRECAGRGAQKYDDDGGLAQMDGTEWTLRGKRKREKQTVYTQKTKRKTISRTTQIVYTRDILLILLKIYFVFCFPLDPGFWNTEE